MLNASIEEILMYFYSAIPSFELDEDNIIINEEMVFENSKEIYLKEFAKFLNNLIHVGYKVSGSIMSRLLSIIEYDGYQHQILEQYIEIITKNMKDFDAEFSLEFTPKKAIEYINAYINSPEDSAVEYMGGEKFIDIPYVHLITEIKDPIPMIINDIQEWLNLLEPLKSTT